MYETRCQSRFDSGYWMLGAGALGTTQREGMGREEGGGRERERQRQRQRDRERQGPKL